MIGRKLVDVELERLTIEQWRERFGHLLDDYHTRPEFRRKDQVSPADLRQLKATFNTEDANTPGQIAIVRDATDQIWVPAWFNHDTAVREFLITVFPRFKTTQKRTAALWFHVIRLHRQWVPAATIARMWNETMFEGVEVTPEEYLLRKILGEDNFIKASYVRRVVQRINELAEGRNTSAFEVEVAEREGVSE